MYIKILANNLIIKQRKILSILFIQIMANLIQNKYNNK